MEPYCRYPLCCFGHALYASQWASFHPLVWWLQNREQYRTRTGPSLMMPVLTWCQVKPVSFACTDLYPPFHISLCPSKSLLNTTTLFASTTICGSRFQVPNTVLKYVFVLKINLAHKSPLYFSLLTLKPCSGGYDQVWSYRLCRNTVLLLQICHNPSWLPSFKFPDLSVNNGIDWCINTFNENKVNTDTFFPRYSMFLSNLV